MYLKELISNVFKNKKRDIIAYFINSMLIISFYFLLFEKAEIIYPLALSLFVFTIYFIIEVFIYKKETDKINEAKNSPNYICIYENPKEEKVLQTISQIHKEYNENIYELSETINEKHTLFSQWIHNMKTSITVIDLAYENSLKNEDFKYALDDIKEENNKLKKNLEECLNVLRLDEFSKDYVTSSHNLNKLIVKVINENKKDFIYKGVFPKVEIDTNIEIYTDEKWFIYMIEQIIINGIKYSIKENKPKLYISAKEKYEKVILTIRDEGIGIKEEDLPRVFEAFFTGENGRKDRNATGIGLYMVKSISEKLNISVNIESKIDIGTTVTIEIPQTLQECKVW